MLDPNKLDKYLYIRKTPTWLVILVYLTGIISWYLVVFGFSGAIAVDPFYRYIIAPIIFLFTVYHSVSFGINLFYRRFNLEWHFTLGERYWRATRKEPSVNVFLPICGEDIEVLKNTWKYVSELRYSNFKVYVLDDSKRNCDLHKRMAEELGFNYFERPNKGEMKKAGNLKYAYERTKGEFIVIFDADFAPHPDFIQELLPYMSDPKVGIVQSPQYFETSKESYRRSPLAYAAAYQEEIFYRVMQVAKDRFNSAICCGSNAIYRRAALETIGGPKQVDASEDSRTGYALLSKGWITRYVPILLALGICPDNPYAYFHQQHRWCRGRSELVLSKEFFNAPVSFLAKLCNLSGFVSFVSQPFEILISFQLFWTLFFYNQYISISNSWIFYPYLIFSLVIFPLFHLSKMKKESFFVALIRTYASAHAIIGAFFGKSVAWIATNAKHTSVSPAFRQTMIAVGLYVFAWYSLIALSVREGMLHPFNYNYYSVQFWVFFNLVLSSTLLWQMYRTIEGMRKNQVEGGNLSTQAFTLWQLKTAGAYTLLTLITFLCIVYVH